jgi:hypothetical protein
MKLEPPCGVCKEASQFQHTFWEKHDITSPPVIAYIYLCVRWYATSYFFKPSNWNVRQAFENVYAVAILSYTDCWCLVHFSSNTSCNRSRKVRLCFGYRIKTGQYIHHRIMAAGYTARKFCYKACCHLDVPVTVMLGRVNEALLLKLMNCVALPTSLERAMKDLCCFSITTSMRFQRLQACCETAI